MTPSEATFRRGVARSLALAKKRKRMTATAISAVTGLNRHDIYCYLSGTRTISLRAMLLLADALGCTIEVDVISEGE